jgi:hypothetical protein
MAGLFNSPDDVRQAESNALRTQSPQQILQGSIFNLGNVGGKAITRGVSGLIGERADTRSAAEKQSEQVQKLARQIDFRDPKSIEAGANSMNQAGFQTEAFKLLELLPTPPKPKDQHSFITNPNAPQGTDGTIWSEVVKAPDGSDAKTVQYRLQLNQATNKVEKISIGEQGQSETTDTGGGASRASVFGGIDLNVDQRNTLVGQLAAQPAFSGAFGDASEEDMVALPGLVLSIAEQLKKEQVGRAIQLKGEGRVSEDQMNFMFSPLNDSKFIQQGLEMFIEGGGFNQNIDEDLIGAGSVEMNPFIRTDDLPTLRENAVFRQDLDNEMDAIGLDDSGQIKGFVGGNPKTGEFRLDHFSPEQMRRSFQNMPKTNDDMAQKLKDEYGVTFTPAMLESHAASWDFLREDETGFVESYLAANVRPDEGKRFFANRILKMTEGHNAAGIASATRMKAYLDRIGRSPVERAEVLKRPVEGGRRQQLGIQ